MANRLHRILELCESHGFIKPIVMDGIVDHFKYGPLGELLTQNIRSEWVYSNVTNREENVYLCHDSRPYGRSITDCKDAFVHAQELNQNGLPFGLAMTRDEQVSDCDVKGSGLRYFHPTRSHSLRYIAFISPSQGQQFFYRWQRQRKMWWRKFSVDPGRYSLSEVRTTDGNGDLESAHVSASFPWGEETLETITNHGTAPFHSLPANERSLFEVRDGLKKVVPYVVESVCTEATAVVTYLCDAFTEPTVMGTTRQLLRLHRKLAPYKTTFAAAPADSSTRDELRLLVTFLNQGLRKAGVCTLLPGATLAKKSLESQFSLSDCLGIPFTIVLSDTTLQNGVVGVRSRETTLEEQSHVSKLQDYMQLLMKNY